MIVNRISEERYVRETLLHGKSAHMASKHQGPDGAEYITLVVRTVEAVYRFTLDEAEVKLVVEAANPQDITYIDQG